MSCCNEPTKGHSVYNEIPPVFLYVSNWTEMVLPHGDYEIGKPVIHSDGRIEYLNKGGKLPPEINGFKRVETDPYVFEPLWSDCKHRLQGFKFVDGFIDTVMICGNPDCPLHRGYVGVSDCANCPKRKTHPTSVQSSQDSNLTILPNNGQV